MKNGLQEVGWLGMDWIDMAQYKDMTPALLREIINL
jgi:hypothetical protein